MMDYPIVIFSLSEEDGGGYLCKAPDLKGCFADGDTPQDAAINIQDAISVWVNECKRIGREVPLPCSAAHSAQHEKSAIIAHLNEMVENYDDLDNRVEVLTAHMQELIEQSESFESWVRFSEMTKLPILEDETSENPAYC